MCEWSGDVVSVGMLMLWDVRMLWGVSVCVGGWVFRGVDVGGGMWMLWDVR